MTSTSGPIDNIIHPIERTDISRIINPIEQTDISRIHFDELYRLDRLLGRGAYSVVREAFYRFDYYDNNRNHHHHCKQQNSPSSSSFAVKCIDRTKLSTTDEEDIYNEVLILRSLNHNHIVQLNDVFTDHNHHFLVMEKLSGGDLFDRIIDKTHYSEEEAKTTCRNILLAVEYIHSNNIAHRDLKPENLLLSSNSNNRFYHANGDDTSIKIADFGYATRVMKPNSLLTACGSRNYIAPEILKRNYYDERIDLWSVGVILYILLSGLQPFNDTGDDHALYQQICNAQFFFNDECWTNISLGAKHLICCLLQVHPTNRISASQALHHSWFVTPSSSSTTTTDATTTIHKKTPSFIDPGLILSGVKENNANGAMNNFSAPNVPFNSAA